MQAGWVGENIFRGERQALLTECALASEGNHFRMTLQADPLQSDQRLETGEWEEEVWVKLRDTPSDYNRYHPPLLFLTAIKKMRAHAHEE